MQKTNLYPFLMQPALHTKVWGGRKLNTLLGKELPTDEPYGESWEVHDTAKIVNGALAGRTLGELLPLYGKDILGASNDPGLGVPLLLKFLDAAEWLSVQVHPNDAQAHDLENEPRGKAEAWYILDAEPGARIVIGVEPGTTREEMAKAIRENRLEDLLVYVQVEPGDVLFNSPGTIHALGPGIVIYEIQQSSDTTYRLYDWGRMGLDGKPRPLHIEKSLAVARTEALPRIKKTGNSTAPLVDIVRSEYFLTVLHQLSNNAVTLDTQGLAFHLLTCIDGSAAVICGEENTPDCVIVPFNKGETVFVPACLSAYQLTGQGKVLRSSQM
jgi:mannose-6-phosphate isomerase